MYWLKDIIIDFLNTVGKFDVFFDDTDLKGGHCNTTFKKVVHFYFISKIAFFPNTSLKWIVIISYLLFILLLQLDVQPCWECVKKKNG